MALIKIDSKKVVDACYEAISIHEKNAAIHNIPLEIAEMMLCLAEYAYKDGQPVYLNHHDFNFLKHYL